MIMDEMTNDDVVTPSEEEATDQGLNTEAEPESAPEMPAEEADEAAG
ncbi:MAG: hypothetical protein JWL82_5 [Parcubacteria group bacterium]|nr:hypothetical protein [Parcubacteria group bacterium]